MIKENQRLLNRLHVLTDGAVLYLSLPAAFWIRFCLLPNGIITVPLSRYLALGTILTAVQLFAYAAFGLYQSFRKARLRRELERLWLAGALVMGALLSFLFVQHYINFSRLTLVIWFLLSTGALSCKRIILRRGLRYFRQRGYNQKHVLLVGGGEMEEEVKRMISEKGLEREVTLCGYLQPARVREMMEIDFGPDRTPLTCRGDPRFSRYFDHIWKELKDDDSQK